MRSKRNLATSLCALIVAVASVLSVAAPAQAATGIPTAGINSVGMSPNGRATISAVNYNAEQTAWNFFRSRGLTRSQAAGVIGNLEEESGLNPWIWQYGGGPGRGIAQWSAGGRWDWYYRDNVAWYANVTGGYRWSLQLQLQFVWYELTSFSYYGYWGLHTAPNVYAATLVFQNRFEGCGACDTSARLAYAYGAYNRNAW